MTNPATPASAGTHRVVTGAIDVNALVTQVARPGAGGIATFLGVVRDHSLGRKVLYLFYEAYPPMAIKEMERLEAEVRGRWEIEAIAIVHRVGRLEIGEASVGIAVSAPHRREAIEACHYAIDRLKQTVPVWKKEYWEGGEVWIENAQGSTITRAQA
jgi:molybdopterin synthase catalytic subunit